MRQLPDELEPELFVRKAERATKKLLNIDCKLDEEELMHRIGPAQRALSFPPESWKKPKS